MTHSRRGPEPEQGEVTSGSGLGSRILVVDDNRVTRKLVRHTLAALGHEVIEACDGAEALVAATASRPNLVLLDLTLPDVSGLELLAPLRAILGTDSPILAFTGFAGPEQELRLREAKFDAIVQKPAEPSTLRTIVEAYLRPLQSKPGGRFGEGRRLLVVDDDDAQRKLFAFKLGRLGFEVSTAPDGHRALEQARAHPPDVVVSDLLMPKLDGYELCAQIRADEKLAATPVILLTNSYVEEVDRALATRVGADAYLVRSADIAELAAALQGVLGSRPRPRASNPMGSSEVQADHSARLARQLDRQLDLNSALTKRASLLAAELAVLGGLTRALATNHDPDEAIDDALNVCFDAGGVAWGLLITRDTTSWSTRSVGLPAHQRAALPRFDEAFVRRLQLKSGARAPYPIELSALGIPSLQGAGLVVPIVLQEQMLGSLVLRIGGAIDDHLLAFFEVVSNQLALVIALTRSFEQLERASRSQHQRAEVLASVVDAVGQPLLMLGLDGEPTVLNPAGEEMALFRKPDAATGRAELEVLHSDMATPYEHDELPTTRALRGEAVTEEELVVRRAGGNAWMTITARPIRGRAGEIRGAVAIVRDVTEFKKMQALQATSDRLATVGVLAAGVAHEINNPLTCVMAELEMAIEDLPDNPGVAERLRAAHDAAARVRTIVNDLRTLSRSETESRREVSVQRALQTAVRMASVQVRPCATLVMDVEGDAPVLANEPRLVQVFLNLIVNAAQAIGPGDARRNRITIRSRVVGGEMVAEVIDTGPGMTPDVRQRVFTPFFTTKPAGVGTGLGLSISQRIVSSAGGSLECESIVGEGTTFRVRLPLRQPQPIAAEVSSAEKPSVLVVDDDPLAWQLTRRALQPHYELHHGPTVAAAMRLVEAAPARYDTILCASEHAAELSMALRAHDPTLEAAVLLLGRQRSDQPSERPCLAKPYSGAALRAFVDDHRRHRELLKRGPALDKAPAYP